nr:cytochrome c oxidase subunit II [Aureimonas jatrophae]
MLFFIACGLYGCAGNLSVLDPAGPSAAATATLGIVMFSGATLILLLVTALVLLALWKPGLGARIPQRVWLVWGGLVFTGSVLAALLVFALATGERLLPHRGEDVLAIEARPEQWRWHFRYPDGRETEDVLHLPAGRPIDIRVVGGDVIHSFWVPRLAGKIDAIPGHVNTIRILADRPGTFGGVCSEFCGVGHTDMRFTAMAHAAEAYPAALDAATAGGVRLAQEGTW